MVRQPLSPLQKDMLDLLRDIARHGHELPSDQGLSQRLSLHLCGNVNAASLLLALVNKGYIEIDRFGYKRVVRLTDTGESTAIPDGVSIAGVDVRIGGDPCWYCGTRPDAPDEFKCRSCR